jgi:glycosyltransferase involved in cell wall biosynthesis
MLSVVIPTRDRRDVLLETLRALEAQRAPEGGFEVIVVDNGSEDGTRGAVDDLRASVGMALELVIEAEPGPARARNAGVAAASGDVLLFLGDDTAPAETDLLARHAQLHEEKPDPRHAIQGRATWTPRREVTQFMEWLDRTGLQFKFDQLAPGPVDPVGAFITAHVSLKRALFDESGGFDTRFPWAAIEDVELGLRLERIGMTLEYRPELLVLHDHPTTPANVMGRWDRVGRSAALLFEIHPDWDRPGLERPDDWRWRLVEWTYPLWRAGARVPLPRRAQEHTWRMAYLSSYARGFRRGIPPPNGVGPASRGRHVR